MEYLHQYGVIHRDLKCDNILLNSKDVAKVADLGLAREVEIDVDRGMTVMAGTPKWEAPEVLVSKKGRRNYTTSADVYSYGMVLFEMISGDDPFREIHDIFELKKTVVNKQKRPKIPKGTNKDLSNLTKSCWKHEADKRPSFTEVKTELQAINQKLMTSSQKK